MSDFIEVYDNALSADLCAQLIHPFDRSPYLTPGRTGGGVDATKKISTDLYLNEYPEYLPLLQQVWAATTQYAAQYFKKYHFAFAKRTSLAEKEVDKQVISHQSSRSH